VLPEEIDAHRQAMLQEDPNPETELAEEIH